MSDIICLYPKQIWHGIVFVGAEVVDGVADHDVFELRYVQTAFCPRGAVVKIIRLGLFSEIGDEGTDFHVLSSCKGIKHLRKIGAVISIIIKMQHFGSFVHIQPAFRLYSCTRIATFNEIDAEEVHQVIVSIV